MATTTVPYSPEYVSSYNGSELGGLLGYGAPVGPWAPDSGNLAGQSVLSPYSQAANPYHEYDAQAPAAGGAAGQTPEQIAAAKAAQEKADTVSFLDDQLNQLQRLLGRTDTGLSQGLQQNEDQYNEQSSRANADKERQYAQYEDQRVDQNRGKLGAFDQLNKNANNGFRSLSQIIGRASGRGSSAFQEMLPDVIGKDVSSRRAQTNDTFGRNLAGIDKAQGQYDISFADVLDDLFKQKRSNESGLRTGIEGQRQDINSKMAQNAADRARVQGGDYAAVKAAQNPYQQAIDSSRDSVEGFFNQFRTAYTPKTAVAAAPELSGYTTDRAAVNAGAQGGDPTNPFSSLLRKRLQGMA
jgi:hypothetical protein